MAKKFNKRNNQKRSGRNDCPGQLCLNMDVPGRFLIERTEKSDPTYAYWLAFLDFLDKSGEFSRTWHLLQGILKDPDLDVLVAKEARFKRDGVEPDEVFKDLISGVRYHLFLMTCRHNCESIEELKNKAEKEGRIYRASLNTLLYKAASRSPIRTL